MSADNQCLISNLLNRFSLPMSTSPTSIGLARHLESDKLMIYCAVSVSVESIPCMNNCGIDKELGYVALHIQSAEHDSLITLSLPIFLDKDVLLWAGHFMIFVVCSSVTPFSIDNMGWRREYLKRLSDTHSVEDKSLVNSEVSFF